MVQAFYIALFIMAVSLTILLVALYRKHISVYYTLLFGSIIVSNMGHMQLFSAHDLEAALYANQVIYLSASFLPFFSMMCVADICRVKLGKLVEGVCIAAGGLIFTLVSTIGINDIYYKSVNLVYYDEYSCIEKEYGPLHILYPTYLVLMSLLSIGMIFFSLKKGKMVSSVTSRILALVMFQSVFIYMAERFLHTSIDYLPLSLVIMQTGILILLNRISLYDISAISGDNVTQDMDNGVIMFNSRGTFTGADKAARTWFPELNDLVIDRKIKSTETELLQQINKWIKGGTKETAVFERGGFVIEARHQVIKYRFTTPIHFITLRDDTKHHMYMRLMENFNTRLEEQVEKKTEQLKHVQDDIIIGMASIVENRDNNTGGHIQRTSDVVNIFVNKLLDEDEFPELTSQTARCIEKAAPLHDFGKIAIPDAVLNKPGKFIEEEYEIMKIHSEKGAVIVSRILKNSDDPMFRQVAVNVAHYHHEKWNGTGYPSGLSGTEIPFEARVMALADVFDALVSKRIYKDSFGYDKAFEIIGSDNEEFFDPELRDVFLKCRPELEALYDSYTAEKG